MMEGPGCKASVLHASVYSKRETQTFVVAHVDEFLCVRHGEELEALFALRKKVYEMKRANIRRGSGE